MPVSENNRFFIWVWRFNAILLALLGISLAASAVFVFGDVAFFRFEGFHENKTPADNFLAAAHAPAENVRYELSGGTHLDGTNSVMFNFMREVEPSTKDRLRISSGPAGVDQNTVNILVVDGADATAHWLFRGLDNIIFADENQTTTISASDAPKSPVVAVVIEGKSAHPDRDGTLIPVGPDELYYYRIGEVAAVKFFSADDIRSVVQIDAGRIVVVYQNGQSIGSASFSTNDFKLLAQSRVAPVPK
jgi:hypothetical protein